MLVIKETYSFTIGWVNYGYAKTNFDYKLTAISTTRTSMTMHHKHKLKKWQVRIAGNMNTNCVEENANFSTRIQGEYIVLN